MTRAKTPRLNTQKHQRISSVVSLLVMLAVVALVAWAAVAQADRAMRAALLQQTHLVARSVDAEKILALEGTEADLSRPAYLSLKKQLASIRQADVEQRFIYLLGQKDHGALFIFVDDSPVGDEEEAPAGMLYEEAPKAFHRVIETGVPESVGPYTDRWGAFVSGCVPLIDDRTGETVAILAIDYDAENWKRDVATRAATPVGLLLLLCISGGAISAKQKAMRRSETNFRTFFETIDALIVVALPDGQILYTNKASERTLGYSAKEFAQMRMLDLHPREKRREAETLFAAMLQGEREVCLLPLATKSGALVPVETRIWFGQWNDKDCIFSASNDITERKRAEARATHFGRVLESSLNEIYVFDAETLYFIDVNRGARENLGYSVDEMRKMTPLDIKPEFTAEKFAELVEPLRRREQDTLEITTVHQRKDASLYPVEIHLQLMAENEPVFVAFIRDITMRNQAADVLRASEERYRGLLQNLKAGIVVHAPDTSIIMSNPRASELLGLSHDQMKGLEVYDPAWQFVDEKNNALSPEDYPVKRILTESTPITDQIIGIRRPSTNNLVWVTVNGFPIFDGKGSISEIVVSFIDITERKQAEAEREALQDQLRQSQKLEAVGLLAGGVAHDFNNMLTVILGHADMAIEQVDPTEPLYADLQEIKAAGQRSADLTRQLLAFSRQEMIAPKVLDLNQVIAGMLRMLQRLIGEDIGLTWLPGQDLWSTRMDPSQIDQILANLCVNARDAIAGVGKLIIATGNSTLDQAYCTDHVGTTPGEYVWLTVSDTGSGMDEETLSRLFEPFFTTKALGKGTGLGLATVYGAIKQNNGHVTVESEPGQGATFRIYLPRHLANAEPMQIETDQATKPGQETILLVEDEKAILELSTRMLTMQGYTVLAASTPGEALRMGKEYAGEIHLLVTDVIMPEMNGLDLFKKLLPIYPHIKRLFMSGYTFNVIADQGILAAGVNFIQKPFSQPDLGAKVRELLDEDDVSKIPG